MARYRLVDLFSGCGGLTSGFVSTGLYEPVAAVEIDPQAAASYAVNFGEEHIFVGDIGDWVDLPHKHANVLVGGPPCQGFSALGKQDPSDPRNRLWREYVRAIRRFTPEFFVLENVPQFLKSGEFALLLDETKPGGELEEWRLEPFVLNTADYGVAQARRRAVVIGRRADLREVGPPPIHERRLTLADALDGVEPSVTTVDLPGRVASVNGSSFPGPFSARDLHVTRAFADISLRRFEAIPAGGNRRHLPDELLSPCWRKHRSGSGDVMGRLSWDKPSVTIRTEFFKPEKGRYLHPEEDRPLTHYEAALIQGFPEDFLWCGTKTSIARQIGNAVPPPLAAAVAKHLAESLPLGTGSERWQQLVPAPLEAS